ncbi:hypothetical protein AMS69_15095 [Haloarcula rubripromontorii]|uniref:Polysaccharide deacetylase family protein n=1 Tax=Haloarcula rubripromontorii TaxID=1705562 RepID=A0A0M9AI17_9EURY|nr:polysaccharide deacetylase family protein [Haloarcula rubripromontorii]KOX91878.1 hypothetical protein AMS69_15095 [Haloarcula rubripromontorii]NLV05986.1 polysaccharide deacetylase family protein [Haloarcula rubripromontorii]
MSGSLVISLDTELQWGFHGIDAEKEFSTGGREGRSNVDTLLDLFDAFDAPVTWAVVGHLFLDTCDGRHADIEPPRRYWFDTDPGTSQSADPLRYGRDIVENIVSAPVDHEIGSHTFSHVLCHQHGCTEAVLETELKRCRELASSFGVNLRSLVFPQNQIDMLGTVADAGFTAFRGLSPERRLRDEAIAGRYRRFARYLARRPAPTVQPVRDPSGLWELPASQYFPYVSPGPLEDSPIRLARALRGLECAHDRDEVIHLWAHPHNFTPTLLKDLRRVLEYAERIDVPVRPMADAVAVHADRS